MIITDQEFVNDVKRKLESYKVYVKQIEQWSLEVYALETKINKVASGSPKKLPEGNSNDEDWRSPLFEDIENFNRLIKVNELMIELIISFIERLNEVDKKIICKLYLAKVIKSQESIAIECGYTRNGLQKRVNKLIKEYWKY